MSIDYKNAFENLLSLKFEVIICIIGLKIPKKCGTGVNSNNAHKTVQISSDLKDKCSRRQENC
jgi:hypothetical protein